MFFLRIINWEMEMSKDENEYEHFINMVKIWVQQCKNKQSGAHPTYYY
jgi:hypothetical protein